MYKEADMYLDEDNKYKSMAENERTDWWQREGLTLIPIIMTILLVVVIIVLAIFNNS